MHSYFPVMLLSELGFAVAFSFGYACLQDMLRVPLKGWHYGLGIGAIFAALQFGLYAYMPISLHLALLLVVDALVEPVLCGIFLSCLYKK